MAERIEIRPSGDGDREAILTLAEQVFGPAPARVMRDEWTWQWQLDPRLEAPGHVGVVAVSGREIVASTALLPAGLFRRGQPVPAWWSANTMVHPGHRRRGIAERMFATMLAQRPDAAVLGKGISAPALPMLQKCGFELVDVGGYWQRTIDLAPSIARWLGRRLARPFAALPNAMLCRLPRAAPVVAFKGDFDARFDELWSQAAAEHAAITRRDAEVLNWRYRRHPLHSYRVLLHAEGARLRGYVVIRLYERRRCLRARICDLLATGETAEVSTTLLVGALHDARLAGADRVDCFASEPTLRHAMRRIGFLPADGREPLAVYGVSVDGLYVTAGDGDGG